MKMCWCRSRRIPPRRCWRSCARARFYRTDLARGWAPDLIMSRARDARHPRTGRHRSQQPDGRVADGHPSWAARPRRPARPGDSRGRSVRGSRLRRSGRAAGNARSRCRDHLVLEPLQGVSRARLAHRLDGHRPHAATRRRAGGDRKTGGRAAVQQRADGTPWPRRSRAIGLTRSRSARR